jgi:hypothetical protein
VKDKTKRGGREVCNQENKERKILFAPPLPRIIKSRPMMKWADRTGGTGYAHKISAVNPEEMRDRTTLTRIHLCGAGTSEELL